VTTLVPAIRTIVYLLRHRQEGQGLVEYTLLIALIAFVVIAALSSLGTTIITKLYGLANSF
jgi:Flp pilus assembly pilin Flp